MRTNKEHVAIRETSESAAYFMEFEVEDGGRGRGQVYVLFCPFPPLMVCFGTADSSYECGKKRGRESGYT